jgi:hypothetical protein
VDIIADNVPDLSDRLYSSDKLRVLSVKLPNLEVLHMGRNRIQDMDQLNCLEDLHLEHLLLFGPSSRTPSAVWKSVMQEVS